MSKSKYSKLRGIVGNAIVLLFSVFALAFMAMPMYASKLVNSSSVFEAMGDIGSEIYNHSFGEMRVALIFFLILAIVACVLIITSIVGLVGAVMGKKQLNMTLINRILSIVLVVLGLLGLIFAVVAVKDVEALTVSGGSVLPMVFAIFAIIGAFVAPSKKKA